MCPPVLRHQPPSHRIHEVPQRRAHLEQPPRRQPRLPDHVFRVGGLIHPRAEVLERLVVQPHERHRAGGHPPRRHARDNITKIPARPQASARIFSMPTVLDIDQYGRELGAYTRRLRKSADMTQEQLAEHSTLSADTIRRLETGSFSPSLETMFKLAQGLGLSPGELLSNFERDAMTSGVLGMLGAYRRSGPRPVKRFGLRSRVSARSTSTDRPTDPMASCGRAQTARLCTWRRPPRRTRSRPAT